MIQEKGILKEYYNATGVVSRILKQIWVRTSYKFLLL